MAMQTDRKALRSALEEILNEHDLHLERLAWSENFEKETVTLTLKAGGSANVQADLPFDRE